MSFLLLLIGLVNRHFAHARISIDAASSKDKLFRLACTIFGACTE